MSGNSGISWAFWGLLAGALLATSAAAAQAAAPAADAAGAVAAPDAAAPMKAKPKKVGPPTVDVVVSNKRAVTLTALLASASGSTDSKKIAGPLEPGKTVVVHLAHDKACMFDVHGVYADGGSTDATGLALCKDKAINLIE